MAFTHRRDTLERNLKRLIKKDYSLLREEVEFIKGDAGVFCLEQIQLELFGAIK